MQRSPVIVIGVAALASLSFACTKSNEALSPTLPAVSANAPADGSTLKASTPTPQSPINDQRLQTTDRPTLSATAAKATFGDVPLQYRFQLLSSTGALVSESPLLSATNWLVNRDLDFNTKYTWRVRAEYQGSAGSWSSAASFFSAEGGFIRGSQVFDPLLDGKSVGNVGGGTFIQGQGWRANSINDYINYDIPTLTAGTLEFDITGVESDEPGPYDIGMKFYSMGDGTQWDFTGFRNQPWKASLDKKSGRLFPDESGVIEHIFRLFGDDNRTKTGRHSLHENEKHHIRLSWGRGRVLTMFDDEVIADENYSGEYAPPNHRIALGCSARGETLKNAIWSKVSITPQ
jgi:hypothetical protein